MGQSHFNRLGFETLDACFGSSSTATALGSLATNQDMPIRPSGQCVCFGARAGPGPSWHQSWNELEPRGAGLAGDGFPVWTRLDRLRAAGWLSCTAGHCKPGQSPV